MRKPDYPSRDSDKWAQVDTWFAQQLAPEDTEHKAALAHNAEQGLPPHDVSALQGKMLALFIQMTRAVSVLEIGSLGGYSTIWMANALPANGSI